VDFLTMFVGELRQVGIPVSMVEAIDAAHATTPARKEKSAAALT